MFVVIPIRPSILHGVNNVAKFSSCSWVVHFRVMKGILKHLQKANMLCAICKWKVENNCSQHIVTLIM
jgi:hypothetical protein